LAKHTVLYGLSANDPLTIAAGVALIAVVSALAGYAPARRTSKVDPMEALRRE
jgi:putative ABC transport system permease protein